MPRCSVDFVFIFYMFKMCSDFYNVNIDVHFYHGHYVYILNSNQRSRFTSLYAIDFEMIGANFDN